MQNIECSTKPYKWLIKIWNQPDNNKVKNKVVTMLVFKLNYCGVLMPKGYIGLCFWTLSGLFCKLIVKLKQVLCYIKIFLSILETANYFVASRNWGQYVLEDNMQISKKYKKINANVYRNLDFVSKKFGDHTS